MSVLFYHANAVRGTNYTNQPPSPCTLALLNVATGALPPPLAQRYGISCILFIQNYLKQIGLILEHQLLQ